MRRILEYDRLCEIPNKIREHAEGELNNDLQAHGLANRYGFLVVWLTILPWRLGSAVPLRSDVSGDGPKAH
jgi:hypothetical protein